MWQPPAFKIEINFLTQELTQEIEKLTPTLRAALFAWLNDCFPFEKIRKLWGESEASVPVNSLKSCVAWSVATTLAKLSSFDSVVSTHEEDFGSTMKSNLASLMLPANSKLGAELASLNFWEAVNTMASELDVNPLAGGTLCSFVDANSGKRTLATYRNMIFAACTSLSRVDGISDTEKTFRDKVDENLLKMPALTAPIFAFASEFEQIHPNLGPLLIPKLIQNEQDKKAGKGLLVESGPQPKTAVADDTHPSSPKDELDSLIGLSNVKLEVSQLIAFLAVQKERKKLGLSSPDQTLHFVFSGNPGTGKTTVARLLARILHSMGEISKPTVVECGRSDLVAGYVGQTAIKTSKLIESAKGGVLFIDEAYTLSAEATANDFGQEAIDTLLREMENCREELVVIVAGYPDLMNEFIQSNPGLESRFTRFINFDDYSAAEMCLIFNLFCDQNDYALSDHAKRTLSVLLHRMQNSGESQSGNGRLVRNLFEQAMNAHAMRLAGEDDLNKDDLTTLMDVDVRLPDLVQYLKGVDFNSIRWRAPCPHCGQSHRAKANNIGKEVNCRSCNESFICPWHELIED